MENVFESCVVVKGNMRKHEVASIPPGCFGYCGSTADVFWLHTAGVCFGYCRSTAGLCFATVDSL